MTAQETIVPASATSESTILATADAPKPVTPAEDLAQPPAKALDPIAETNILEKARDAAKPYWDKAEPYVHKMQEATKPFTDKAAAKLEQIVDKIEGNNPSTTAMPTSAGTLDKSIDNASATVSNTISGTTAVVGEAGEKTEGLFEQGLHAVHSTFNQITDTIDQKTSSNTHPGLITQVTNVVHKGIDKVEVFLNETTDAMLPPTTTTASVAAVTTTNAKTETAPANPSTITGDASHPVQTTTNAVPHIPISP
ncbi:hypothetical protein L204_100424 [Cryptococcus depauperatus]|nr:hypothetical protein L204_02094 [Cryptococcus depauperatus CBS 7855]